MTALRKPPADVQRVKYDDWRWQLEPLERAKHPAMQRGAVCVVVQQTKAGRVGSRWQLDRITTVTRGTIYEVESGVDIVPGVSGWTGLPQWRTYAIVGGALAPIAALRAADLWRDYVAAGKPVFRNWRALVDYLTKYGTEAP